MQDNLRGINQRLAALERTLSNIPALYASSSSGTDLKVGKVGTDLYNGSRAAETLLQKYDPITKTLQPAAIVPILVYGNFLKGIAFSTDEVWLSKSGGKYLAIYGGTTFIRGTLLEDLAEDGIATVSVSEWVPHNAKQTITITGSPDGGDFTITFDGKTTPAIKYNATNEDVEQAFRTALIFFPWITGGPFPDSAMTIELRGNYESAPHSLMTTASSLTGGASPTITVTNSATGADGEWGNLGVTTKVCEAIGLSNINEIQTIELPGATSGTFTITFGGATTTAINYDADANTVNSALVALSSIVNDANISVSDGPLPSLITVEFTGSLGNQGQDLLVVTGLTATVERISAGGAILSGSVITANWCNERSMFIATGTGCGG